jgi:hypothetical protein
MAEKSWNLAQVQEKILSFLPVIAIFPNFRLNPTQRHDAKTQA